MVFRCVVDAHELQAFGLGCGRAGTERVIALARDGGMSFRKHRVKTDFTMITVH
jgi:hypothetical protein